MSNRRLMDTHKEQIYLLSEEGAFDLVLEKELRRWAKPSVRPSLQIQAWREYERAKYFAVGRHPNPVHMGYNLWMEAPKYVGWAYQMLDVTEQRLSGISHLKAPRLAIARIAESVGYRYLRGLESIECKLNGADLAAFRAEREDFRIYLEVTADMVHSENDRGQAPRRAAFVVSIFERELLQLCEWLIRTGRPDGAALMRENIRNSFVR